MWPCRKLTASAHQTAEPWRKRCCVGGLATPARTKQEVGVSENMGYFGVLIIRTLLFRVLY